MTEDSTERNEIAAAGGVLWRTERGRREVAVIHRPKYDDWTLAKGKLDPGETHSEAALREVAEETGFTAELGVEIGEVTYDHDGRPKRVRYWAMRALGGQFSPNAEVDELVWVETDAAFGLLTYERDRDILARFVRATGGG